MTEQITTDKRQLLILENLIANTSTAFLQLSGG
jgi:hypothetical protein